MTEAAADRDVLSDELDEREEAPANEDPSDRVPEEDVVLDISSDAVPTKKIRIDELTYELYSYEHLSADQEAAVTACFSQFQNTYLALDRAKNEQVAIKIAKKVREHRMRLIGLMTNVPREVYAPLTAAKQGKILRAIQDEIGAEVDEETGGVDEDDLLG